MFIHGSRSAFMVPGWFFMIPGEFSLFIMIPGTRLTCILAPRSCQALPAVGRLWPSDDDDDDGDDDADDDDGDGCKDGVPACTAPIGVTSQPDYRDTAQAQSGQFLWVGPPNQK